MTHFGALLKLNHDSAVDAYKLAFRQSNGNLARTAEILGVTYRSIARWRAEGRLP